MHFDMASICMMTAYPEADFWGRRLVTAYQEGALEAGHAVTLVDIQQLSFDPYAYSYAQHRPLPLEPDLRRVVDLILRCNHLVLFVPVFKTHLSAVLQTFFQRLFTTDHFGRPEPAIWGEAHYLHMKTARIISTLDVDAWHALQRDRSARFHPLKKSVLELLGFRKVRTTTIAPAYELTAENDYIRKWEAKMRELGEKSF